MGRIVFYCHILNQENILICIFSSFPTLEQETSPLIQTYRPNSFPRKYSIFPCHNECRLIQLQKNCKGTCQYPVWRQNCRIMSDMNEIVEFIGKWLKLKQTGKEANLVLKIQAGNAWETLSFHIGHRGPSQQIQQQKAFGGRNGPAHQRCQEK